MAFPTISALAQKFYDQVERAQQPGDDEAADWPLAKLVGAIVDPLQWVADALKSDDDHPAGGRLLDPDTTPSGWVGWLAQFHGVRVTKGAPEATQRDEAKTAAGRKRGRPASMVADVKRTLTGTKDVGIVSFLDGRRWRAAVRTRPSETPDSAATQRAARGQKPYGVVLTFVESATPLVGEYTREFADITVDLDTATLADVT